jgi:HAD superfamily hydrolase (TIGR01549 family)
MPPASQRFPNLQAISFDFGNTLVDVGRATLDIVVERMTATIVAHIDGLDPDAFRIAWAEERDRQFAQEIPRLREVDLDRRVIRVLARLRGMSPPASNGWWSDAAAALRSTPREVAFAVDAYSRIFVEEIPPPVTVGPMLERLAGSYRLAVLSNWPLASTIDAYVEAAGWRPFLRAVVVSQRVGTIKPDLRIFRAAEEALGVEGPAILHVGDDWAADVVGAKRAGWRAAYLRDHQVNSALPASQPDDSATADLQLDTLEELEGALA